MKKIFLKLMNVSLVLITGIFIASCSKDENTTTPPSLIGTWTAKTASVTAMDGTELLISYMAEYYIEKGLREDSALIRAGNFEKGIIGDFMGTLQIFADSTCTCDMGEFSLLKGSSWSLNPSGTVLTVKAAPSPYDPNRAVYATCDVLQMKSSKLLLQIPQTLWLNNDQSIVNDVIPIKAVVNFTKQ
jgi:hypothetical protein